MVSLKVEAVGPENVGGGFTSWAGDIVNGQMGRLVVILKVCPWGVAHCYGRWSTPVVMLSSLSMSNNFPKGV